MKHNFRGSHTSEPIGVGSVVVGGVSNSRIRFLLIQINPNTVGVLEYETNKVIATIYADDPTHITLEEFYRYFDEDDLENLYSSKEELARSK